MRCSQAVYSIRALGGGDVPSLDLAVHLETCAACAAVFAEHQRTLATIKALQWPTPSAELVARLGRPELLRQRPSIDGAADARTSPDVAGWTPAAARRDAPMARRGILADAFAAALLLAVVGWVFVQSRAAAPVTSLPPNATPIAGTSAAPRSEPTHVSDGTRVSEATRVGDGGRHPQYRGVAGQPIELAMTASWGLSEDLACRRVWLELGDGAIEELVCRGGLAPDAYPGWPSDATFAVTHAFAAGTFFPQLTMELADGSTLVQTAAQVIVGPEAPRSLAAEALRLRALPWAFGFGVVGVLWLVLRRTRDRWFGLAVALGSMAWFGGSYAWPLAMSLPGALGIPSVQGGPSPTMHAYLNGLRGQVGLDPLDSSSPLADYTVETVQRDRAFVYYVTQFTYTNGTSRRYRIPIEAWNSPTRRDGLGRLRTEHRELPGLPFADAEGAGIALGSPVRLDVTTDADRHAESYRAWFDAGCTVPHGNLVPAPDGSAFLAARWYPEGNTSLWHVPTDGRPDRLLGAKNVYDYQWSPDSRYMVLVKVTTGISVVVQAADSGSEAEIATVDANTRPGVTSEGVWYPQADGVWRSPWAGGAPLRMFAWPTEHAYAPTSHPRWRDDAAEDHGGYLEADAVMVRPSPDATRVAYTCRGGLCIVGLDGSVRSAVDLRVDEVTWSPDGQALAAIEAVPVGQQDFHMRDVRKLWLIERDGSVRTTVTVAPEGWVSPPSWTLDSERLFLTACPYDGRRIITVDAASGEAHDLSQPRWDAWAALMPSENAVLLSNGRGGYWRAGIVER